MRVALAGASGSMGRMLVPRLVANGAKVVLIDRDVDHRHARFVGVSIQHPEDSANAGGAFDLLIRLEDGFDQGEQRSHPRMSPPPRRVIDVVRLRHGATACSSLSAVGAEPNAALVIQVPAVVNQRNLGPFGPAAHMIRTALRQSLSADRLARFLLEEAPEIERTHVLLSEGQRDNPVYAAVIRGFDLAFALTVILGFWWLLAGLWLAVRLDSPGPGIFRQTRIGRRGHPFTCWKFRTMAPGTRQAGTHELSADAVTRIGGLLRASKLDELPQVFNILRGEMALIGPRPCLPVQAALIEARARRGVLDLMPGISGLAQVEGIDMSDPERLAARDADYAALQCIGVDLGLMIATTRGRGRGDRVASSAPGETEK